MSNEIAMLLAALIGGATGIVGQAWILFLNRKKELKHLTYDKKYILYNEIINKLLEFAGKANAKRDAGEDHEIVADELLFYRIQNRILMSPKIDKQI
ncbi:MAG: hypothetical protein AB7E76_13975 [Deferribacterales bacterium]